MINSSHLLDELELNEMFISNCPGSLGTSKDKIKETQKKARSEKSKIVPNDDL